MLCFIHLSHEIFLSSRSLLLFIWQSCAYISSITLSILRFHWLISKPTCAPKVIQVSSNLFMLFSNILQEKLLIASHTHTCGRRRRSWLQTQILFQQIAGGNIHKKLKIKSIEAARRRGQLVVVSSQVGGNLLISSRRVVHFSDLLWPPYWIFEQAQSFKLSGKCVV